MSWVWAAVLLSLAAFFVYVGWLWSRLDQIERAVSLVSRERTRNQYPSVEGKE